MLYTVYSTVFRRDSDYYTTLLLSFFCTYVRSFVTSLAERNEVMNLKRLRTPGNDAITLAPDTESDGISDNLHAACIINNKCKTRNRNP